MWALTRVDIVNYTGTPAQLYVVEQLLARAPRIRLLTIIISEAEDPSLGNIESLCPAGLARLRCARAAARTSLLSRRWSRLWSRLTEFTFRDVAPRLLRPALDSLVHVPDVSLLDIHVPEPPPRPPKYDMLNVADVASLIRAAAGLSPVELRFNVSRSPLARRTRDLPYLPPPVNLPGFHRATSVDLCGLDLFLSAAADPPASCCMFPALEALSLSGCHVDAAALLLHCPRLRVLRAAGCSLGHAIRSASLQELVLENKRKSTGRVHVDVPALKQLTLSINTPGELRLSISAPIVEKVLWRCCYSKPAAGIGPWGLAMVRLETAENNAGLSLRMESDDSSLVRFLVSSCSLYLLIITEVAN
ncbi:uncharacterized protein [Aegilops tauschii subsp. strangulata]|uniref:uncharacterized protein n=1 Tax=Aegilops tauschii subsp. strangulata TaxID=200361 RepID=UPI003CC8CD23